MLVRSVSRNFQGLSCELCVVQAREENGQLGGQLAEAKIRVARAEGAVDKLRAEQAWLLDQKRAAETGILHLQTSGVDVSSRLDMLQKDHQKALDDLASARDQVKVCLPFLPRITTWSEHNCVASACIQVP